MSLHASVIAIGGDRLANVPEIFERCSYRILGSPLSFANLADGVVEMQNQPPERTKVKKLAYRDEDWTYIDDPEMVMFANDEAWRYFSQEWQTRILAWLCAGSSNTYGYGLFENGRTVRKVISSDGTLYEDEGRPLDVEDGIDWSTAFEDDVLRIADLLGAPFTTSQNSGEVLVYVLDESHLEVRGV